MKRKSPRVLYFDCFSGISGDMILGALIDVGLDLHKLQSEINKLGLEGWHLEVKKTSRQGLTGTRVRVITEDTEVSRKVIELVDIVENSSLDEQVKKKSKAILERLGEVESKVHGEPISNLHLHELGSIDTIIDIVGAITGIRILEIDRIYSSAIPIGKGFVYSHHGPLPIPAPATIELLASAKAPIYRKDIEAELVTPTGAAILTQLVDGFGDMPKMQLECIGYGAGENELVLPNLLRVFIGTQTSDIITNDYIQESCTVIEANIDDMNPELYSYLMEKLFQIGVLDAYMVPIYMKKNRPGVLLGVITREDTAEAVADLVLRETTTLGVRIQDASRKILPREEIQVPTRFGDIKVKVARVSGKIINISPEYQSCKAFAEKHGVPLKEVYQEALRAALSQLGT
jgi:uncharacterized protein (TIGR00299 family) protein